MPLSFLFYRLFASYACASSGSWRGEANDD